MCDEGAREADEGLKRAYDSTTLLREVLACKGTQMKESQSSLVMYLQEGSHLDLTTSEPGLV